MIQSVQQAKTPAGRALVLAALLVVPVLAAPSAAQDQQTIAAQKGQILKGFFASPRLAEARAASPDAVGVLEAEARQRLEAGLAAMGEGRAAEALEHFDIGLRSISQAAALASAAGTAKETDTASADFIRTLERTRSLLAALADAEDVTATEKAEAAALSADLEAAEMTFAKGATAEAQAAAHDTYGAAVELVSAVRRGHTVLVERTFETPEDEYAYEHERHRSYVLLVDIAVAERVESQPSFAAIAARLSAEADRLRAEAEAEHGRGETIDAIATMEQATGRLGAVLRAAGLPVGD